MEETRDLSVDLNAAGGAGEKEMRALLFRVIRELLSNVAGHTGVKPAKIKLHKDDGDLTMEVTDQGKGFAPDILEGLRPEDGFDLTAADERIRQFGGTLEIDSAPQKGTRAAIRLLQSETQNKAL